MHVETIVKIWFKPITFCLVAGTWTQHIGIYKSLLVRIEIGITSMEVLIEIKNAHIKIPIAG